MLTQAGIALEINTSLASGQPAGITAAQLRTVLLDMNTSVFQSVPPTVVPSANTILNATSGIASVWTSTPSIGTNGVAGGSLRMYGSTSGNITVVPGTSNSALYVNQQTYGAMLIVNGPDTAIANQISTVASISGMAPVLQATGSDTNVNLNLQAQGTGSVVLLTTGTLSGLAVQNGVRLGVPTGGDKGVGTLNSAGTIYINNAPIEAGQRVTGTVSGLTGTTSFSLSIPPTATVQSVMAYTTTAFTSGTVTLEGGTAVGDNAYFAATSIKSLGIQSFTLTGAANLSSMPSGSPNFYFTLNMTGTLTNVGAILIVVRYLLV